MPAETRRITKNGFQLGLIRYWDPLLTQMFPVGTRILVRYHPRDLSKVFVPSAGGKEYLDVPYADLRRPPITRAELEHARTILTLNGERHPTEDQIFATTAAQRRLEDASRERTRQARRNASRRPGATGAAKTNDRRQPWTTAARLSHMKVRNGNGDITERHNRISRDRSQRRSSPPSNGIVGSAIPLGTRGC